LPSQPCNKCQCVINWDSLLTPPSGSPRSKDNKMGWWREDLSKEIHTKIRCDNFVASGEFKTPIEPTLEVTEPTSLKPTQMQGVQEPKAREMDVSDFAEKPMRAEIKVHCKFLKIIEEEVKQFLSNWIPSGQDVNPARVGMYMKMVLDMMEKK